MLIFFPLGLLGMSLFFDLIVVAASRLALLQASFYMIAAVAVGVALVTGWLGELVDRLFVGVDDGARVDTPSSLSSPTPQRR